MSSTLLLDMSWRPSVRIFASSFCDCLKSMWILSNFEAVTSWIVVIRRAIARIVACICKMAGSMSVLAEVDTLVGTLKEGTADGRVLGSVGVSLILSVVVTDLSYDRRSLVVFDGDGSIGGSVIGSDGAGVSIVSVSLLVDGSSEFLVLRLLPSLSIWLILVGEECRSVEILLSRLRCERYFTGAGWDHSLMTKGDLIYCEL